MLSGEDVVTDDLLHLVADHMKGEDDFPCGYDFNYNFTDGPVKLPKRHWRTFRSKFEVIIEEVNVQQQGKIILIGRLTSCVIGSNTRRHNF